jgi:hypothetical protein
MKKIIIPIIERKRSQVELFNKLPDAAKRLFVIIAKMHKDDNSVSLDDIRNLNMFGTTSDIEYLLYALESRGFGEIKVNRAETYFFGNKILMQSVL